METEIEILWVLMGGVYKNPGELRQQVKEMQTAGKTRGEIVASVSGTAVKIGSWLGKLAWLWPW